MNTAGTRTNRRRKQAAAKRERDARGRFVKGNRAAIGNRGPPRKIKTRLEMAAALTEGWTDDDIAELGKRMMMAALGKPPDGFDAAEARLVLDYAIGKPTPRPDDAQQVSHAELLAILGGITDALNIELAGHGDLRARVVRRIWRVLQSAGVPLEGN